MRIFLLLLLLSLSGWADPQVESIFARARQVNPALQDMSASLDVDMETQLGPLSDHPKLTGTYYFKREDRHQIQLPKAPSYLKRHSRYFGFSLPKLERFHSKVVEDTAETWKIQLVPKVADPNTDRVEMWVSKQSFTVPQYDTYYHQEGKLTVAFQYTQSQGFTVLEKAVADLQLPSILLSSHAEIRYANYTFNQGLSDELFKPEKRPKR
jgi:outer membrane lipoprotein-sorting protein